MNIVDNLGLSEFDFNDIVVYPNPASNHINIKSKLDIINSKLFDVKGKLILKSNQKNIDISHLSKGLYFLKLSTNKSEIVTKKIVID